LDWLFGILTLGQITRSFLTRQRKMIGKKFQQADKITGIRIETPPGTKGF
jgi:hypothetical protein